MGITIEDVLKAAFELKDKLFYYMQCQQHPDTQTKLAMYELIDLIQTQSQHKEEIV